MQLVAHSGTRLTTDTQQMQHAYTLRHSGMQMQAIMSAAEKHIIDSMKATAGENMAQLYVPSMLR